MYKGVSSFFAVAKIGATEQNVSYLIRTPAANTQKQYLVIEHLKNFFLALMACYLHPNLTNATYLFMLSSNKIILLLMHFFFILFSYKTTSNSLK